MLQVVCSLHCPIACRVKSAKSANVLRDFTRKMNAKTPGVYAGCLDVLFMKVGAFCYRLKLSILLTIYCQRILKTVLDACSRVLKTTECSHYWAVCSIQPFHVVIFALRVF
jgi:hypothetical protein